MATDGAKSQYYFVYVLKELCHQNEFKVGFSADPELRVKDEDRRRHGKFQGLPKFVELYRVWRFESENSARFIEQCLIDMLDRTNFKRVDINDWFEIDAESLEFILEAAKRTIASTQRTETDILMQSQARRKDKPYGQHMKANLDKLKKSLAA